MPTRLSVPANRGRQDGGAALGGRGKDLIDPLARQARSRRIVNRYEVDVRPDMRQGVGDRVFPFLAAGDHLNPQDRDIGREFRVKRFAIFRADDDNQLFDVVAVQEFLRRVNPHGAVGQWGKRLLVMLDRGSGCPCQPPPG